MAKDWSDSTVIILTCDRDKELMDLCRQGIELFWPGIRLAVLHDKDLSKATELPYDIRELTYEIPYLRKVFDLPYLAETDNIYCIDSDCMLFDEPKEWEIGMHLSVLPGTLGVEWLRQGSAIWESLGQKPLDLNKVFCGGCWSAKRSLMFEPYRDLAIKYVRECVKRNYARKELFGHAVICEQCLLNGLWHFAYEEKLLANERYPLYHPNPYMAIYHLSDSREGAAAELMKKAYRNVLARKRASGGMVEEIPHD